MLSKSYKQSFSELYQDRERNHGKLCTRYTAYPMLIISEKHFT